MEKSYAIVVDVLDLPRESEVFIAYPFELEDPTKYTNPVTDVINKAIQKQRLKPNWISWEPPGVDIIKQIHLGIKTARMLIVVCTPVKGQLSPNVMYELGLADALGKPTLVMSTLDNLPFDIGYKKFFKYNEAELRDNRELLESKLRNSITELLSQSDKKAPLVLDEIEDVHLLKTSNRMFLQHHFWEYAMAVRDLAHNISNGARALISHGVKLSSLSQKIWALAEQQGKQEEVAQLLQNFIEEWGNYTKNHDSWLEEYIDDKNEANIKGLLSGLEKNSFKTNITIQKYESDFHNLWQKVESYKESRNSAAVFVQYVRENGADKKKLFNKIEPLVTFVDEMVKYAGNLIVNLVGSINDAFKESTY